MSRQEEAFVERKDNPESLSLPSSVVSQDVEVTDFRGPGEDETQNNLERTPSMLQRVQTRLSFFNERLLKHRKLLALRFLTVYLIMSFFILGIFSIYWGTGYKRNTRYDRLRMLVVIEDAQVVNGTEPVIGNTLKHILEEPLLHELGNWLIQNLTEFEDTARSHGNSIYDEVARQVHHQEYWAGIYVPANASNDLKNAIVAGDTSYNVSQESVKVYYETGRDMMAMNSYVTPNIQKISARFAANTSGVVNGLLAGMDASSIFSSPDSREVATIPLQFYMYDARPWNDPTLFAPSQVGLIYMIIVTFFGFNFFLEIHQSVASFGLKTIHLILYRILSSIFTFFIVSLVYSLVTLAFQVDFTVAFGHSGFLVYWMTNFLTMWAVGAMNETMAMWCIMYYPPLLGFWMLFWVIVNISSTFTPIALLPKFYRYGYALPIHASYEITKVIFFDTYKGAMGRNFGILVAWDAFGTIALLLTSKKFGQKMGAKAKASKEKIKQEVREEYEKKNIDHSVSESPRERAEQ